jgi:tetratricopeptide (TPR) repeat protein
MSRKKKNKDSLTDAIPVALPPSLASHVELYDTDPDKALGRLHQHMRRRGNDPVGYMLLAFMYKQAGDQKNALESALKARIFAPGSLFMQKLPYFLTHPDRFEAWITEKRKSTAVRVPDQNEFLKDIDNLIDTLSDASPKNIRLRDDHEQAEDYVEATNRMADKIATETLASIYEMQGKTEKAVETYKLIAMRDPSRSKYCDEQITRLQDMANQG